MTATKIIRSVNSWMRTVEGLEVLFVSSFHAAADFIKLNLTGS